MFNVRSITVASLV